LNNAKTETLINEDRKLKKYLYGIKVKQQTHTFSSGGEILIGYRINDGWDDTVNEGARSKRHISSLAFNKETIVDMVLTYEKKMLKGRRLLGVELQKLAAKRNNEDFSDGVTLLIKHTNPLHQFGLLKLRLLTKTKQNANTIDHVFSQFSKGAPLISITKLRRCSLCFSTVLLSDTLTEIKKDMIGYIRWLRKITT
jgi:hypothetical protein